MVIMAKPSTCSADNGLLSHDMHVPTPPSPDPPPMSSVANRPYVPEISRERIIDLVADMNKVGFGVLPGYSNPADLEDLQRVVGNAVASAGGEYVVFTGKEAGAGTLPEPPSATIPLLNFLREIL